MTQMIDLFQYPGRGCGSRDVEDERLQKFTIAVMTFALVVLLWILMENAKLKSCLDVFPASVCTL